MILFTFRWPRQAFLKDKYKKGMTLLEMLISVGIFAFMFMFISQLVRQSYRQTKKLKKGVTVSDSLSHSLEILKRDFRGASYFLDTNENLRIQFPIEPLKKKRKLENFNTRRTPLKQEEKIVLPVISSPHFVFQGEDSEVEFSSYSFVSSDLNRSVIQWIKIRYYLAPCVHLEKEGKGNCLFRATSKYWNHNEKGEPEEKLILLRDLSSLEFSYLNGKDVLDKNWRNQWNPESVRVQENTFNYPKTYPFPLMVKMEIEKNNHKKEYFFSVSNFYLRTWNPYDKAYPGFPNWNPPKKKDKKSQHLEFDSLKGRHGFF